MTLTSIAERMAVVLSLQVLTTCVCRRPRFEQLTFCMRGDCGTVSAIQLVVKCRKIQIFVKVLIAWLKREFKNDF